MAFIAGGRGRVISKDCCLNCEGKEWLRGFLLVSGFQSSWMVAVSSQGEILQGNMVKQLEIHLE